MKAKFYFSLLRYIYDPLTQEFINIGVVLYSPAHEFLRASFTTRYGRISRMFGRIDGASFRATANYIERKVSELNERIARGVLFKDAKESLESLLSAVLPPDDSAIRFAFGGVGISDDPARTLDELFSRYVARYENPNEFVRRDEDDVWRVFQEPLRAKRVYSHFESKRIATKDYEYVFQRSWRNGIWHLFEPVSFDLSDERSILEKASRWVGRTVSLSDSSERFKLFLLLGEPTDPGLSGAFQKAKNLLSRIPVPRELVRERDAEHFAEEVEQEFEAHALEGE
jgi:hypothetical protein